ncbi:MAG: hypothetical protein N2654_06630 [Deltaproteobacteria bacterium]|nr:hypothetical protein [Deltaproteobacteria bacterium]
MVKRKNKEGKFARFIIFGTLVFSLHIHAHQCSFVHLRTLEKRLNNIASRIYRKTEGCEKNVPLRLARGYLRLQEILKKEWLEICGLTCLMVVDPVTAISVKARMGSDQSEFVCETQEVASKCVALQKALGVLKGIKSR